MKAITLNTKDGLEIVADYYEPSDAGSNKGAILLHMMPATRESWREFAPQLAERGYHVIAPDLRGHGESQSGSEGYKSFTDEEHQASSQDVEASYKHLREQGVEEFSIIGASIGANLALEFMASHADVKRGVLLSAGLNYKGLETLPLATQLKGDQGVLFVASHDDGRSSGNCVAMNEELMSAIPEGPEKRLIAYENAGHGTDMFDKENPDLAQEILQWL